MIMIRLARAGKKNDPVFKVVAIEKSRKNTGKALEKIGHWHPASGEKVIDEKKIAAWIKKGAQVSPSVKKLIEK